MTRKEFDTRYHIRTDPSGIGFYVMNIVKRKVEAGPMPTENRAKQCLFFMRQHCQEDNL